MNESRLGGTRKSIHVLNSEIRIGIHHLNLVIGKRIHHLPFSRAIRMVLDDLHTQIGRLLHGLDFVVRQTLDKLDAAANLREINLLLSPVQSKNKKPEDRRDREGKEGIGFHIKYYAPDASPFAKIRFDGFGKGRFIDVLSMQP